MAAAGLPASTRVPATKLRRDGVKGKLLIAT